MEPLHEELLRFTDAIVEKIAELETHNRVLTEKVGTLTAKIAEIENAHQGDTRDQLKTRLDDFEKKLHVLMVEYRNKQDVKKDV